MFSSPSLKLNLKLLVCLHVFSNEIVSCVIFSRPGPIDPFENVVNSLTCLSDNMKKPGNIYIFCELSIVLPRQNKKRTEKTYIQVGS